MKYRDNIFYILVPFIQIVFFITVYEFINYFAHKMEWVYSRGVAWGISMQGYFVKYVAIVVLSILASYFIARKVLLISIASSLIFISFVLPVLKDYPFRGGVVILIGTVGIFINYAFLLKYRDKNAIEF